MAGGGSDVSPYSDLFGGVNYIEVFADDKAILNPLRIGHKFLREPGHIMLLYYTAQSRYSCYHRGTVKERQKQS